MNTAQNTDTTSWWGRLIERCYVTSTTTLARRVKQEAGATFNALINDLERPLEPHFEQEVARQLAAGKPAHFSPARTLMPVMMQRFGLQEDALQESGLINHVDYVVLRDNCNACAAVGDCWKAMRASAELDECRKLCPNAKAFDALVSHDDNPRTAINASY
ncbi:hypothetical protein KF947_09460 [Halomonas sp. FeN2]|uniref:Uncharacterized protein n=1 Tax=Vreelandella neptunia TaxID=115551 RepID=A0ABZ0YK72_9GAMM|nr:MULTISPECIES: DUF6455 family protein [Halomonas]MDN3562220.1 hypothetical protein [Halomonas neptunia]TDV96963.1 hypothetical protein BDK62_10865 [Halomonas alkaliantarctica]UBR51679.1 hypothetical protein KF947_09460 [Halomonas sp. FeN2]WQH12336.1 hypothetical protein SR894_19615 [Halomonas neptunia]